MRREIVLTHEFVEFIPEELKDATLYVSIRFATVVHKCCCGCGNEVVTPLSPTDWKLTFNGKTISLDPSIGNWGFNCQSHYSIAGNRLRWAPRWSHSEILEGRTNDRAAKERYFEPSAAEINSLPAANLANLGRVNAISRVWRRLRKLWHS
jgi:hypothetical protein